MYAIDFEFDGRRLSDFGCILTSFSGMQDGAVPSGASTVFSTAKSSSSDIYDMFSSSYDAPFSATFEICKNPCIDENASNPGFTPYEISNIQKWLCRRTQYCKFKILADDYEDIYWNGYFTSQQYMSGSSIIGLQLVFTADAPYAYLEDVTLNYSVNANEEFVIESVSDEEGYIIPNMEITLKSGGTFELQNDRDTRVMSVENCSGDEVLTIDGKYLLIDSSLSSHDLSLDFNYMFPRVFNTYDNVKNVFTANQACDITVTYTPAIKVGF